MIRLISVLSVEWLVEGTQPQKTIRFERGALGKTQISVDGELVLDSPGSLGASARLRVDFPVPLGDGHDAIIKYRALRQAQGVTLWLDGQPVSQHITDEYASPLPSAESITRRQKFWLMVMLLTGIVTVLWTVFGP